MGIYSAIDFWIATWLTICYHHPQNSPDSPASLAHFERILSSPKLTCHPLPAGEFQLRMSEFPLFLFWWGYIIYFPWRIACFEQGALPSILYLPGLVPVFSLPGDKTTTCNCRLFICLIHIPLGCQVEGSWGVATKEALIIRITSAADNVTRDRERWRPTRQLCCCWWVFLHQNPFETICDTSKWVDIFFPEKAKGWKLKKLFELSSPTKDGATLPKTNNKRPWKQAGPQKEMIVFQASISRCELLVSGSVSHKLPKA